MENSTPTEFYLADLAELRKQLVSRGWKIPPPPVAPPPPKSPVKAWLSEGVSKPAVAIAEAADAAVAVAAADDHKLLDALDEFFGG